MSKRSPEFDDSDDALEGLLAAARWPEPTAAQVERLKRRWFLLRRGERPRGLSSWAVAAIAAGLLVATTAAGWRWLGDSLRGKGSLGVDRDRDAIAPQANVATSLPPEHVRELSSPRPERVEAVGPASSSPAVGLTTYEQVAALAVLRRDQWTRTGPKPRLPPPDEKLPDEKPFNEKPFNEALDALAAEAEAELASPGKAAPSSPLAWQAATAAAAQSLGPRAERFEPALWAILQHGGRQTHARRLAAARLLSQLATPRSAAIFEALADVADFHPAAIAGLARVADGASRIDLLEAERQDELQRLLLTSLLDRGDAATVEQYLRYVGDPVWRKQALAAARDARRPPVELLFALLAGPQVSLREAAAQTLGNVADPAAPRRLARYAIENVSRREALLGLLSSPSWESAAYVERARQDVLMIATVQAVENEFFSTELPRR